MFQVMRMRGRGVALILVAAMTMSACQMTDMPSASASTERVSFTDGCAPLRQPFDQIRAERQKRFANNIAAGAALGVIATLIAGGNTEDALKGALIGGLAGAASAYVQNAQARGANEQNLQSFVNRDARNEAAQNDRLVTQLQRLNACRLDQLDKVRRDVRAKTLTEGQGRATVRVIQGAIDADRRTVNAVAGTNKSYQAYQSVLNQTNRTAATRTQTAVNSYKPKAQTVRRTSRGKPAFTVAARASAPTEVAAAEISRTRLNAAAQASNEAAANAAKALIGDLDSELPI